MSSVLLVCPEPLGHKQPAGIGIRFLEMARVLGDDGHSIVLLSPDGASVAGCKTAAISPQSLRDWSASSDVAIVQGHVANELWAHSTPIPTVVDLYDPFLIENLHYFPSRGAEVFIHDYATLMASLRRGDLFLCASSAQRLFYLGMLLAVGRLNPVAFESDPTLQSLLRIAPFGVSASPSIAVNRAPSAAVLFGGIYDWYDPLLAIDAIALARREIEGLTITFTTHPNPSLTPQGKTADAIAYVRKQRYEGFVHFAPWVPYERRAEFYAGFAAALMTFPPSLETDLSMRTRVYDFLWAGLPVITSSAPGTDELIERYGAGEVVADGSAAAIAAAIARTITNREAIQQRLATFARDHQWETTLAPLLEFVRSPRRDATREMFAGDLSTVRRSSSVWKRLRRRMGAGS